jgi:hypothetical protein
MGNQVRALRQSTGIVIIRKLFFTFPIRTFFALDNGRPYKGGLISVSDYTKKIEELKRKLQNLQDEKLIEKLKKEVNRTLVDEREELNQKLNEFSLRIDIPDQEHIAKRKELERELDKASSNFYEWYKKKFKKEG